MAGETQSLNWEQRAQFSAGWNRFMNTPGLNSGGLGNAVGRIAIDTSQLGRAVSASQQASRQIQSAFGSGLQRGIQGAGQAIARQATQIAAGLDQVARSTAALSAAGAGLTLFGVTQAQRLQRVTMMFRILSGDARLANERLAAVNDMADRSGQSFLTLAESALSILPAIGRAKVDIKDVLSLVQRLALLDVQQGPEGAALAVRELLSGQYTSLAARFEMSRTALQQLVESSGGSPEKIIAGLDQMVSAMGLTQGALDEMGDSGVNAFGELVGAAQEAAATGFAPFLESAQRTAGQFADFLNRLRETRPEVLKLAADGAVLVAAIAPVALVLGTIAKAVAALAALITSPLVLGALTLLAGLAGGVVASTALVQRLADSGIGDPRLRTDSGENPLTVLFERLKQALFSLVATFTGAGIDLKATLDRLAVQWQMAGQKLAARFEETVLRVVAALMGLVASLYEAFPFLDTGGVAAGMRANQQAVLNRADAAGAMVGIFELAEEWMLRGIEKARGLAFEQLDTMVLTPLLGTLFPELAARTKRDALGQGFSGPADKPVPAADASLWQRIIGPFRDALGGATDAARQYAEESADILRDFRAETDRILQERAITDSRRVADELLADTRARRDLQRQMSRSDSDFWTGIARAQADFNAQVGSDEAEALAARAEALAAYQDEQTKRTEDHLLRLADIEKSMMLEVQEAAFRLDASGVFNAFQRGQAAIEKENSSFDRETAEREREYAKRVEETRKAFAEERDERVKAFAAQQADQIAQYQLQRARQLEDYAIQRADLDEDRRIRADREAEDRRLEDQRREAAHQQRLFQLAYELGQEAGLWDALRSAVVNAGNEIRTTVMSIFDTLRQQSYPAPLPAPLPGATPTTSGSAPLPPIAPLPAPGDYWIGDVYYPRAGGPGIPRFAAGGMASPGLAWVGERGPELVQFSQPARVFNADQSRRMGGGDTYIEIGSVAPVFGDIGQHSEERITELVEGALYRVFAEVELRV